MTHKHPRPPYFNDLTDEEKQKMPEKERWARKLVDWCDEHPENRRSTDFGERIWRELRFLGDIEIRDYAIAYMKEIAATQTCGDHADHNCPYAGASDLSSSW